MAEKKAQAVAAPAAAKYEALTGIEYPDGPENFKLALAGKKHKRIALKKGEFASDLPPEDIPWMLREKFIKAVK
jgi:hypothetical protein